LNAALNDQSDSSFTNRYNNQDKTPRRESKALLQAPINHLNNWNTGKKSIRKSEVFALPNELIMDAEDPQDDP